MEVLKTFRHEIKYIISYSEFLYLRKKLDDLLEIDRNQLGYMIRSMYFDSINDDDYYEKLSGEVNRKKIRLRIYDKEGELVKLEIKQKYDIHQLKESLIINKQEAQKLIDGEYSFLLDYNNDIANKIYTIMTEGYYRPKVIIEYNRIAYTSSGGTRITFDFDIKRSYDYDNFFKDINYLDLTDKKDIILEIKYDRFLEPYITDIINNVIVRGQSVSKYIMGRNV